MASTYTSKYIIPGRRAGPIKQIINCKNCNTNTQSNEYTMTEPFVITSGSPIIEYSNGYFTITFLDNGEITFLFPLTSGDNDFNALVVGGGGGGGSGGLQGEGSFSYATLGGGGGAGGEVIYNPISVDQYFNYNVIVGQGGTSSIQGASSLFSTIVAQGGNPGVDATSTQPGLGGVGVPPQNNDGGTGGYSFYDGCGCDDYYNPTDGQNGIPITIGSTTTYYAGGGGGGAYSLQTQPSVGGLGGGGNGSIPNAGAANTGGGGGGNGDPYNESQGGQGGSGIVILYFKYNPTTTTTATVSTTCKTCVCPCSINRKIVKNSNSDVIPGSTQRERAVNAIKYSRGGRVVFGNAAYNGDGDTLLGRLQGQPLSKFLSRNRF
jgi:hypothetical protein